MNLMSYLQHFMSSLDCTLNVLKTIPGCQLIHLTTCDQFEELYTEDKPIFFSQFSLGRYVHNSRSTIAQVGA